MASGDLLAAFMAKEADWPASGAAPVSRDADYGYFVEHDDATDSYVIFDGVLSGDYAGGGVDVEFRYLMAGPNTTDVAVLSAAFQSLADGDDKSGSVTWTPNTANETVPDAAEEIDIATIAFTHGADMASVAAGQPFRLRVGRVGSNGSDTAAGDLRVLAVRILES